MNDKNFYLMLIDTPSTGPHVEVIKGPDITVNDGVSIDGVTEEYEMMLSVDRKVKNIAECSPCDIYGPSRSLIFSKRFIELLATLKINNIQYLNTDVTFSATTEKVDYKVANVVGIVSGLDLEKSTVVYSRQGNIVEIENMIFDENKLSGHKIFRLKESIMHIVVHKSIKEAIENAGLTGFMFLTDDEYEPGML